MKLANINWPEITDAMHAQGYAVVKDVLSAMECDGLIEAYNIPEHYRKTISMERYRFGQGEYKYFSYPLPPLIQQLRERIYPHLAPIANEWMRVLKIPTVYPMQFEALQAICKEHQQTQPTVLILQYGKGGHNTLHQDLYGDFFFPFQLVVCLSEDYTGGEFVLMEQRPRAQSKAIVLRPAKGDMVIFTTNFRPVKSTTGYYRANMKHGVSEVKDGSRYTLGIIFHDAK
ncbi:prolyl 4-hydroxylase subunit alpha [Chitinophaga sp. SYP-B3965]|uniref:2OG-Fe(II) oxygenase n=1 Tax=Chitinophaga sp. SYP-B3965 TaxID=2663120 RepID=UPI00129997B0|nr:2OG-Fe(II) oxygenase [Chitinophaga sp. SYP-B3965]MRG44442.1 prolyl 4-hydroxylase subunit alpha [Chitinophaga sp. SYP-B3965]